MLDDGTYERAFRLGTVSFVPHPAEHGPVDRPLEEAGAQDLAETIAVFATPSRLRLLWALIDGERTVDQLAGHVGLTPSATSHQLRVLRRHRLVAVRRQGRHAHYRLHDHHLPELLAAMRHHHEHVYPPAAELPADVREGQPAA
jgi:DNA-binding transcriptional ArsR family regulator